ncbi:MAG: enoyl-CoA hydratase/isomerase family protein [Burkholderiaceae bacterium]|nr:enoyl-CoA hydratase/isomerase family protein [Burkholderiaceae bacterium]
MNSKKDVGQLPLLEQDGGIAHITLRRPSLLNRLQSEDVVWLREMISQINSDLNIRVLVITGTGRAFSSGYDLDDLSERSGALPAGELAAKPAPDFSAMTVELESCRVPTVAKLNGPVYGGSTDLVLSCDFRVGTTECEMFMPASRLGLHYYTEGLIRWESRLGINAAKNLFFTSRTIKAEEMFRIGFITELVAPQELDGAVKNLVQILSDQAPRAVEGMKQALNEIARGRLNHKASDERARASHGSADLREGLSAWQARRKPIFVGN